MIKVEAAGTAWWIKFVTHHQEHIGRDMNYEDIDNALREWEANDIPKSKYIEFQTEESYTLFLLRWS